MITPWWYHVSLAGIVALFVCSQALPVTASMSLVVAGIIALPVLTSAYKQRNGVGISQPAGPRSRSIFIATMVIIGSCLLAALVIRFSELVPWWSLAPTALAFAATVALGYRYDQALRSEVAGSASHA
ncbi:hypothetical protein SAMN04488565_0503 [Leucobacter chromiiresistens]|uniref:Uncharacterized protein n=2 Tax=Leucobacter chromiiresistens TaxID=1079994 RepID=A0A1H0Y4A4_9MICO|nr:hypothetical protein SAMN04488565_0503 [Leucobacter chromiiresistens]